MSDTTPAKATGLAAASRLQLPRVHGPAEEPMPSMAPLQTLHADAGNRAASLWLKGGGVPLPEALRKEMEGRFGEGFADVRIHNDSPAHASAASLRAKAYTHGSDIVFSANRFSPHVGSGKRLLAHELAHVVQQRRGGSAPDARAHGLHETSARDAANAVMQGSESVSVHGSASPGISLDEEDAGAGPGVADKAKRAIADALMRSVGLPPAAVRVGGAAIRGMAEQIVQELVGDGRGAILLGRVATMGPGDIAQLVKGYAIGLVEGMVSPVTDLFGLAVFGERIQNLANDLALTPFGLTGELAGELAALLSESSTLRKSMGKVWGKVKEDPAMALATFFSLSDVIGEFAEKKAYALGKQGGSAIVAGIEAPWAKGGKEKEHQPALLASPLAWVESKAKAAEDWVLDTPWSQMGSKIGYAVGFVAVQVVLFAFTEGIGNAVEQVAAGLGKIGNALGKVSKLVGGVAGKAAELLATVGKGIAFVEEAIAVVAGKLLKPLGKFFEPILGPLGNFFKSLRRFLRKLFGVVEKESAQIVDTAAGKAGALADDSTKLAPKPAANAVKDPHLPGSAGPEVESATPKPNASTGEPGAPTGAKGPPAVEPPPQVAPKPETARTATAAEEAPAASKAPKPAKAAGPTQPPGNAPKKATPANPKPKSRRVEDTKKSLDERIAEARQDLKSSREKTSNYFEERKAAGKSRKGGPKKGIDNAKERLWMLERQKAYPKRQMLEGAEIKGVLGPDGELKSAQSIGGAGREPDFIEIDNGKALMGELKSEWELDKSLVGGPGTSRGGATSVAPKAKMGGQFAAEDKVLAHARAVKGKVIVSGYDVTTGKRIELALDPSQIGRAVFSSTSGWGSGNVWTH